MSRKYARTKRFLTIVFDCGAKSEDYVECSLDHGEKPMALVIEETFKRDRVPKYAFIESFSYGNATEREYAWAYATYRHSGRTFFLPHTKKVRVIFGSDPDA